MTNPPAEPRIQEIVSRLIAEALITSHEGLALWEPGEAVYLQENMLTVPVSIEGDGKTFRGAFASMNITRDEHGTHYTVTTFITNFYNFQRILSWNVLDDGNRATEDKASNTQVDIIIKKDSSKSYSGFSTHPPIPCIFVGGVPFYPLWSLNRGGWVYSADNNPESENNRMVYT